MLGAIITGAWTFVVGSTATVIGNSIYDLGKMFVDVYVLNKDKYENECTGDDN
jgi:hypothetical protein